MAGTGIRNRHKVGDYLMLDDESGFVYYRSDMRRIWDGTFRHKKEFETRQPQEFVYARNDPKALRHIRPEPRSANIQATAAGCVGNSPVIRPVGPATHLFPSLDVLTTEEIEVLLTEDGTCIVEE